MPPKQGTTLAQKQAALQTASNFRRDPGSVSASDARAAASTFNNFRQRHGDQVAAGVQGANSLNQKYGLSDRFGQQHDAQETGVTSSSTAGSFSPSAAAGLLGKKKPAPPLPRKPDGPNPPPVPTSTGPQF